MFGAALLKTIEEAGIAVLTLTEGLQDSELLASRLTRQEVTRQLRLLLEAAAALPPELLLPSSPAAPDPSPKVTTPTATMPIACRKPR